MLFSKNYNHLLVLMGKRTTMDINKIQSALQLLKEERAQIEEYLQNAAAKKKELDKERNASFNKCI